MNDKKRTTSVTVACALMFALVFAGAVPTNVGAQPTEEWVRIYNHPAGLPAGLADEAVGIAVGPSGNVYVTGSSKDEATNFDYATVGYDPSGNELWVARYDGPAHGIDEAVGIAVGSSGNVYVTGISRGVDTDEDYATVAYNGTTGEQLWVARYHGLGDWRDEAVDIAVSPGPSEKVYVTGQSWGPKWGCVTVAYNGATGNQLWAATYALGNGRPTAIAIGPSGNVYVTNIRNFTATGNDYVTVAYDSSGNQLWIQKYYLQGYSSDRPADIAVGPGPSENVYVTGTVAGTKNVPPYCDYATVAYKGATGEQLWVAGYNGPGSLWDRATAVTTDPSGNVYVTGRSHGVETNTDYATVAYNSSGNELWVARYNFAGGNSVETVEAIATDLSGNVYVTGWGFSGWGPAWDYLTVAYDSSGNELWNARWDGSYQGGIHHDRGAAVATDLSGNVYVTGTSNKYASPQADYVTIKYGALNHPPVADAGPNLGVSSEEATNTTVQGTATDEDPDDVLEYQWKEGEEVLLGWTPAGENGESPLDVSTTFLGIGTHNLTLEVSDGQATSSDDVILTIENSAPHAAPSGSGVYEINTEVTLGGSVSDFDGDLLQYQWLEGTDVLSFGEVEAVAGGTPVVLPPYTTANFGLGTHSIILQVTDGTNEPVSSGITVEMVDTTVPTLAPVGNRTILWPPNREMVDIVIEANALDNSGLPVTLTAVVSSNEPEDGLGDGDTAPDWTEPVIDQDTGIIQLQLRAERSGTGDGRVYTVTITATDESGNTSTVNVELIVPHDNRKQK